ncbi:28399_t:CDS:2, partial [Dentiscutata erythropus]
VQNSLIEENSFAVPQVSFVISNQTNITCNFMNANGIHDCTQYVMQPQLVPYQYMDYKDYNGSFSAPGLLFSKIPNDGASSMEFKFYSNDPTLLNASDYYSLPFTTSYKFKLTRRRKDIMFLSWQNYLGFSSNLLQIPYFTSTMEAFPLQNDTPA